MEEIIKNLIKQPNQIIKSYQDISYPRNNNSFEEPEFFKVLEKNKFQEKKVVTIMNIPNENNKIEIIQNNQKIRKKFRL